MQGLDVATAAPGGDACISLAIPSQTLVAGLVYNFRVSTRENVQGAQFASASVSGGFVFAVKKKWGRQVYFTRRCVRLSQQEVKVNSPPSPGTCSAALVNPVASTGAEVELRADQWIDPDSAAPLTYTFSATR